MSACCQSTCQAAPARSRTTDLFHIRSVYTARWERLAFEIESAGVDWVLRVRDAARGNTLYEGQRGSEFAAKFACVEYAIFQIFGVSGQLRPATVLAGIEWRKSW